jgi:hypothetical protein
MRTALPPKSAPPTPQNVKALYDGLTSVIAGHPGSIDLWTFYEEIDAYLGPWGDTGYPIGYGKYYCILFNDNPNLSSDPQGAQWIKRTTVALQEPLRDFVVDRFKHGQLASLKEPEFRAAAFASHPKAYTDGGLATVVLVAPDLIPVIMSIPGKEFNPHSRDFNATIEQVMKTMEVVLPSAAGMTIAAAMPAHSGLFRYAAQRDMESQLQETRIVQWLSATERAVQSGQMDNISALTRLTDRLNATQLGDQLLARRARSTLASADSRKRKIAAYYRKLILDDPELRPRVDKADPGWTRW